MAKPLLGLLRRKPPPGPPKPPPGPPTTKQNEKQNKTKRKTLFRSVPFLGFSQETYEFLRDSYDSGNKPINS